MWGVYNEAMTQTNEIITLKPGDAIPGCGTVVSYTHHSDGGSGTLPHGIALVVRNWGPIRDPYVVWGAALGESGEWHCYSGDYISSLSEAVECYVARGGRI